MIANIGDTIDFGKMGKTMTEAAQKYNAVFGNIAPDKRLVIEQMCQFFYNAANAYATFYAKWDMDDKARIFGVGGSAYLVMIHYENIKKLLGKSDEKEVCTAIDKTSEWLIAKGWYGLPTPYDNEGVKHFKTAFGVVTDMRQFNEIMQRYVEEANANDPRNKNKK